MNIITETSKTGRIPDGMRTIIKSDDAMFERILERLNPEKYLMEKLYFYYTTDQCSNQGSALQLGLEEYQKDGESVVRGYFADGSEIKVSELFPLFEKLCDALPEESKEYKRIIRLLQTRGLEAYKEYYSSTNNIFSREVVDKVFGIVSDPDTLERFLNYDANKQEFEIEGSESPKAEIIRCMLDIFGDEAQLQEGRRKTEIFNDFYIPDVEAYVQRVLQLYGSLNLQRYTNGMYEFRSPISADDFIRKGDEPKFAISPELHSAVYADMPKGLSLEEQAAFIYCRLCKNLAYDEGYMYREISNNPVYQSGFIKSHLESIKPGSKVTCYDFARIFAKLVNEIPGDIEAVILIKGDNREHFSTGVYTDNISATFDATNYERGDFTDDLTKAKLGSMLRGIVDLFDDKGLLRKALVKMYPLAIGEEPVRIEDLINSLKTVKEGEKAEKKIDLGEQIRNVVALARRRGLLGNELTQLLTAAEHADYFGLYIEKAYIGEEELVKPKPAEQQQDQQQPAQQQQVQQQQIQQQPAQQQQVQQQQIQQQPAQQQQAQPKSEITPTSETAQSPESEQQQEMRKLSEAEKHYSRIILMRKKSFYDENSAPIHAIHTKTGEVESLNKEEAVRKFASKIWESGEHRMADIASPEKRQERS